MEGHAVIAGDVLARYAADAALDAPGVVRLVESRVPSRQHKGVRILVDEARAVIVEVHVAVEWGGSIPEIGRDVQRRVAEYLERMADVRPGAVTVVVDEIA